MPKCDFNKVTFSIIEITLRHGCFSVNLLHMFGKPFSKTTYTGLLLKTQILSWAILTVIMTEFVSLPYVLSAHLTNKVRNISNVQGTMTANSGLHWCSTVTRLITTFKNQISFAKTLLSIVFANEILWEKLSFLFYSNCNRLCSIFSNFFLLRSWRCC